MHDSAKLSGPRPVSRALHGGAQVQVNRDAESRRPEEGSVATSFQLVLARGMGLTAPASLGARRPTSRFLSPATKDGAGETDLPVEAPEGKQLFAALPVLLERALALSMIAAGMPIFALVALAVLLSDGRPIFYVGERLGRRKVTFRMVKFRTLRQGADRLTQARLVGDGDDLAIPLGRFLRDTRLDELPQLWNIARGDMSFIGPRPERPQVYETHCRRISGYDRRFDVRPGLIGLSQLFTPHGTQKEYRTLIDNSSIRRHRGTLTRAGIVCYTVLMVGRKLVSRALGYLLDDVLRSTLLRRYRQKRGLRRVKPRCARAYLLHPGNGTVARGARLVDINEQAFLIHTQEELAEGERALVRLEVELANGAQGRKVRSAHCDAYVAARRRARDGHALVLCYRPLTPRSHYMLHQYFLGTSLAPPGSRRVVLRR